METRSPGSADCLIYFKIKQMAATGVCLSSVRSRARGQEPRGSCAKNFSMTLVVKPPLPLLFELQPHHTHVGLLAPSPAAVLCAFSRSLCLCLWVSLSVLFLSQYVSLGLCLCMSLCASVSVSVSLCLSPPLSSRSLPKTSSLLPGSFQLPPAPPPPRLCPHSSPPLSSPAQ